MSVQFVFGGSGSGKTEYLLREILRQAPGDLGKSWFLIVPEQDTLGMARRVLQHPLNRGKGILNIDVLSFQRLAYRVFAELGIGLPRIIDDMGKVMILRNVAGKVRGKLSLYKNQLDKPGFLSELKSQISEFYQYRVQPEMLSRCAERADSLYVRNKLRDLELLYRAFQAYMEEQGFMTEEEVLDRLFQYLPDARILKGAALYFDGFTGFTPVQQSILEEMMLDAARMVFSLDIRRGDVDSAYEKRGPEDLFYLSRQTVAAVSGIAEKMGVEILSAVDLNAYDAVSGSPRPFAMPFPRFQDAPMLDFLERQLHSQKAGSWAGDSSPQAFAGTGGGGRGVDTLPGGIPGGGGASGPDASRPSQIFLREAASQREEIEGIAQEIARAVRDGGSGIRYKDVGVILTAPEAYRDIVYKVFSEAEIPYFLDDAGSLLDSPYAEAMRAALEVLDRDFSFDSMLRFLRALPWDSPAEDNQVDLFENYLRERGIRGRMRYGEAWEEYELLRQKFALPLLSAAASKEQAVSARIAVLKKLMQDIDAEGRVLRLVGRLREAGEQNRAEELERGIPLIAEVLSRLSSLLGDVPVGREAFRDILDAGLSEASVRVIPATLDQVLIGDLTRSRFDNPKLFFIAGMNADQIPKAEPDQKILGDRERRIFREMSIELAPDRAENALVQRFYLYRALTNPSHALYLSYPLRGRAGKGLKAAGLIGDLQAMFPQLRPTRAARGQEGRKFADAGRLAARSGIGGEIFTKAEALRCISRSLPAFLQEASYIIEETASREGSASRIEETVPPKADPQIEEIASQKADSKELGDGYAAVLPKETGNAETYVLDIHKMDLESKVLLASLKLLFRDPAYRARAGRLLSAAYMRILPGKLPPEMAASLYGEMLTGSVTRLEQFAACPFAHFLQYGLRLYERKTYELQAFDIGNLYHAAIEQAFRTAMAEGRGVEELPAADLRALSAQTVQQVAEGYGLKALQDSARNRYLLQKIANVTGTTFWALAEQLRRGSFRAAELEKRFEILREGLRLQGRIDRIDLAEEDGRLYLKIIDYKSGRAGFDLNKVYAGQQLQLLAYLDAAMRNYQLRFPGKTLLPAAVLYYHIQDPILDFDPALLPGGSAQAAALDEERLVKLRLAKLRPEGLVCADPRIVLCLDREIEKESEVVPVVMKDGAVDERKKSVASPTRFRALLQHNERMLLRHARAIQSGDIAISPLRENRQLSACTYCPYHAVCQFDPRIAGFRYRALDSLTAEEIWENLMGEQGDERT